MRFTISAAALLAFAAGAVAQTANFDPLTKPAEGEHIPAGSTYAVTWETTATTNGTVTLYLLAGATPQTLELGDAIGSNVENAAGTYSWAVAAGLGEAATYGIKLVLDEDTAVFQYSFPFHIDGSIATTSSAASASASTSASASASSGASSGSATKTVILSSLSSSSSSSAVSTSSAANLTTSTAVTSSAAAPTTTTIPIGNVSTASPLLTVTSVVVPTQTGAANVSSTPSTVPDSGAARTVAGSLAMVGGLAAALLVL